MYFLNSRSLQVIEWGLVCRSFIVPTLNLDSSVGGLRYMDWSDGVQRLNVVVLGNIY